MEGSTVEDSAITVVAVDSVTVDSSEVDGVTTGTETPPVPTKDDAAGVFVACSGVLDRVLVVNGEETSVTVCWETTVEVPDGLSITDVELTTYVEVDDSAACGGVLKKLLAPESLLEKLSNIDEKSGSDEASLEVKVEESLGGGVEISGVGVEFSGVTTGVVELYTCRFT